MNEERNGRGQFTSATRTPLLDRFMSYVHPEPNSGCWLWRGAVGQRGYGRIQRGRRGEGVEGAHRMSYRLFRGDPGDLDVCHRCDTPTCVNPDHLFPGTTSDNIRDCVSKGRFNRPRGEACHNVKLTREMVVEIRRLKAAGTTYVALAERFGVSRYTIWHVLTGRRWKHVEAA